MLFTKTDIVELGVELNAVNKTGSFWSFYSMLLSQSLNLELTVGCLQIKLILGVNQRYLQQENDLTLEMLLSAAHTKQVKHLS